MVPVGLLDLSESWGGKTVANCVSNHFSLIVPKHFWCIFSLVQTTVGFLLGSVKSCQGPGPASSCVLWMPPQSITARTDFHLHTSCRTPYHRLKFLRIFLSETIQASSPLDRERGDNNDKVGNDSDECDVNVCRGGVGRAIAAIPAGAVPHSLSQLHLSTEMGHWYTE